MTQPDRMMIVPHWAYKSAKVKFLKIFTLVFNSEWRGNGEHKHFVYVTLFDRWRIVTIETRTGVTAEGINTCLPRIYKAKKLLSHYKKDLTDDYDFINVDTSRSEDNKILSWYLKTSEFTTSFSFECSSKQPETQNGEVR